MNDKEITRVLVADDEKPIRDGCKRVLTGKGFDVLSAENGQIALDIMSEEDVSILLLDLKERRSDAHSLPY